MVRWWYQISVFFLLISIVACHRNRSRCNNLCKHFHKGNAVSCNCDLDCVSYGDCCKDFTFQRRPGTVHKHLECSPTANMNSVLVITGCRARWRGPDIIKNLCTEATKSWKDPLKRTPVTSLNTSATYLSVFCALCNNDARNFETWDTFVSCPNVNSSWESLSYSPEKNGWGVLIWNKDIAEYTFHKCNISFKIPSSVEDTVRLCNGHQVSQCPRTFKKKKRKRKCSRYQDPVYIKNVLYKNIHCAKCNGVTGRNVSCSALEDDGKRFTNFGQLFGFGIDNPSHTRTSRLPETKCRRNMVYDMFSKKCRKIVCEIPGLAIKGC